MTARVSVHDLCAAIAACKRGAIWADSALYVANWARNNQSKELGNRVSRRYNGAVSNGIASLFLDPITPPRSRFH